MSGRFADLAYWINERQHMLERRNTSAPLKYGYSDDPNMGTVRYCNVHREDDKVTKWIAGHWRNPNASNPLLTLGMVMARMINWPETLERLEFPDWDNVKGGLDFQRDVMKEISGKKWTSAYTISTCGRPMGKEDYVFDHVLQEVARRSWDKPYDQLADYFRALTAVDGLGSFLAAQVVADLKNTPGHPLSNAEDFWSWSAPGPGSLRGLEAYWGGSFCGRKITPALYRVAVDACYNEVLPHIQPHVGRIHMQDFQNCLCEFSKYIRMKEGDGRVRNSYHPGR